MAFKINNPFTNKDERSSLNVERYMPQSWKMKEQLLRPKWTKD